MNTYNQVYDVDYFIRKFENVPEYKMFNGTQGYKIGEGCALGQCKSIENKQNGDITKEGKALKKLLSSIPNLTGIAPYSNPYICIPARINNGDVIQYQQDTPKKRILAALQDVKKLQTKEVKVVEKIRYVSVDKGILRLAKELELIETN